jgi:pyruvate ferredoxin oxidoreductase delta subunit
VVIVEDDKITIDYDFCKGCGICEVECPKNAIKMIEED